MWQEEGLEHSFDVWEGLFKAPVTGEYRFTIACDDQCTYKMSLDDKLNPANVTTLLNRRSYTAYRNKNVLEKSDTDPDLSAYSEWVSLKKDEFYYVESTLANGAGWKNIDVGMEVKPDNMPAEHPNIQT
jgi:hypothetical protein